MCRIGVDLGGTNIKVGIVDAEYRLSDYVVCKTNVKFGAESVVREIVLQVYGILSKNNISESEVIGVGIGCPGLVHSGTGTVLYSNNFSWEDYPLKERLQEMMPWPVEVRNDAQCAVLGEKMAGSAVGCRNVVLVTLGTGVGSGIIVDGKILEGNGGGGIAGHNVIMKNGRECTCGRKGCLEAYASATALIRETKRQLKHYPESLILSLCDGNAENIDGKIPFLAAEQGDMLGKKIIDEYIEVLSNGIADLINLFRPEKVLIGGGICNEEDSLLMPLNQKIRDNCFASQWLPIPPVETARLKNTAGMIGAASLIKTDREKGK